ncbi:thiol reductant ABC exporter subunit CydD [Mycolicibacterium mucogenicum]|uniref:thiol reductant ABC exporter subunit CydD n=1 Tax=Mycolicibacterium mucogenicum TaxID=56689 RepID=UPI0014092C7D|nr:thiol reductant ABC exporter subunit CydD [Mycolicibacterium mucogenicum]MCX8553572.1 thiol reductant ABC exporter subunit CydD [Mycolicibacterium mucogenicum]
MRRHLAATVGSGVVIAAATLAAAVLTAHVVAGFITTRAPLSHWIPQLLALAALWSLRAGAQWWQARLGQHGATATIADLDAQVLSAVTALPPHRRQAVHDEAAILLTRGLDGLRPYFTRYLPAVVMSVLLTPAAVIVIAWYDVKSALVVLIALPLIPLFMVLIGVMTTERSAAALAAMATLQSRLLDLIAGIPTLRALGRAEGAAPRITELSDAHRHSALATLRIAFLSALVLELLATLGVALVAVGVGLRLVSGGVTLPVALTVLLLAPEVFWPLRRVGVEFHAAQDGKVAFGQAYRLLEDAGQPEPGTARIGARPTIDLEHISIDGRDGPAPHNLTLRATPGSVTVLTGPNGSGKSTALQAILGLTTPDAGRVRVGDDEQRCDVDALDRQHWWHQIGWLPQRPVLVPGTVRENLELLGALPDLDSACRASGFDEVLATLPAGLDTVLGRGGSGLSLGQRQRLALARVLGRPSPVLLLDEPTSHLNAELEIRVLQAIRARAAAGATVIVVGHRDAVLAIGDEIVRAGGASRVHS